MPACRSVSRGCGHAARRGGSRGRTPRSAAARDGLGFADADLRVDPGLGDVVAGRPDLGPTILPWPGGPAPDGASVSDPDDHKIRPRVETYPAMEGA